LLAPSRRTTDKKSGGSVIVPKKDVEDSVAGGNVLFFEYLKSLHYEFLPNSITGSEIISEDELDQLISKASQFRG
jgi:hypothetical protein